MDNTKVLAVVGYILPVLFWLPLLTESKAQPFARFHANQQLLLLIWYVIANAVGMVPIVGWIVAPIMLVLGVVLAIMGLINAAGDTMKPLPVIGTYVLLK